ncbi:hypothetical protein GR925_25930 [Streptomyces sp. HUCO-GS316]|uniref:hypothetical protein n=1 Tax=Streptomyces sp. HUCO-GS316 TaxID=2692198 RepID=UPI00136DE351|nr:hypothetical protein [Streptomyces sp. HUCO-GS316]MXM66777.1 hypothetical protein [Streptomyces sp. HUCO-GS316]
MSSASERWIQRVMHGQGVRPVGHAAPDDVADGPQIPEQSPLPPPPPRSAPRITDWWATGRPHITGSGPAPQEPEEAAQEPDDDEHQEQEPVSKEHAAPAAPAADSGTEKDDADNRTGVRNVMAGAVEDRNMRVIMFNLTAGGVGYSLGLVDALGQFLPAAEHGAVGMLSIFTAAAGAWGAWRCTRPAVVQTILPVPPLSRTVIAFGAAEIGRRFAVVPVDWLNANGQRWGLGADAVSLLLTAGAMCGGFWWFIDRRIRHWHWTARWLFRIPLASALLATGLYAPGTTA